MTTPKRTFVIGDIHGCFDKLTGLLQKLEVKWAEDRVVLLGDLVDRGSHSREVMDWALNMKDLLPDSLVIIQGNHEEMMINACILGAAQSDKKFWREFGGQETLESFYDEMGETRKTCPELARGRMNRLKRHLVDYYEDNNVICCHGSYDPHTDLNQMSWSSLRWASPEDEMPAHKSGKQVIVGHTKVVSPKVTTSLVMIDTGAYTSDEAPLTAFHVEEQRIIQYPES